jgi:hypothetical protein
MQTIIKKYVDVCSRYDRSGTFIVKIIVKGKNKKEGERQSNNLSFIQAVTTSK